MKKRPPLWVLMLAVSSSLLSSCVGNKFYRDNAIRNAHNGSPIEIRPDHQDRFVPQQLQKNFAAYAQGEDANTNGWTPALGCGNSDWTNYFLSFLELDEYGELWYHSHTPLKSGKNVMPENWGGGDSNNVDQRDQFKHAVNLIRYAKAISKDNRQIRLFVFIHGWKNNASDKSGNVWGFRHLLHTIACKDSGIPVVGVYVGWRGAQTSLPVLKEFSFFDRYIQARAIPGTDLLEALTVLRAEAKGVSSNLDLILNHRALSDPGDHSPVVLIGHSMGSLVLERAVSVATSQEILRQHLQSGQQPSLAAATVDTDRSRLRNINGNESSHFFDSVENAPQQDFKSPFDVVIFLNSAAQATDAHQLISALKENRDWLKKAKPANMPLFLALTSKGDSATRVMLPIGTTLTGKKTRDYRETENDNNNEGRLRNQAVWSKHSVATIRELATHVLCRRDKSGELTRESKKESCPELPANDVLCWKGARKTDNKNTYWLQPLKSGWNDTRYWAAEMPETIVSDHFDIFNASFANLLIAVSDKWRNTYSDKCWHGTQCGNCAKNGCCGKNQ